MEAQISSQKHFRGCRREVEAVIGSRAPMCTIPWWRHWIRFRKPRTEEHEDAYPRCCIGSVAISPSGSCESPIFTYNTMLSLWQLQQHRMLFFSLQMMTWRLVPPRADSSCRAITVTPFQSGIEIPQAQTEG